MASFASLRNISIGQYHPGDTVFHLLDARVKLSAFILALVVIVIASSYSTNILLLVLFLAAMYAARLSPRETLASLGPALPLIAMFALLQLLFYGQGPAESRIVLDWGPVIISTAGIQLVVVSVMRLFSLLFATALLTNTTTVSALTQGMEQLLSPLSRIGLPGHELAMVGAIALRFLPILGEQMAVISQAQMLRGVDEESGGRWRIVQNARRLATLIVPLFVDAYRRSGEMTEAMLARCYRGGRGRTHLYEPKLSSRDLTSSLVCLAFSGIVIWIAYSPLP